MAEYKAGRETDLLIAERIMGWRWLRGAHHDVSSIEMPRWLLPPDMSIDDVGSGEWTTYDERNELRPGRRYRDDDRVTLFDVPRFTEDIGAAWTIVERMKPYHFDLGLFNDGWRCRLCKGNDNTQHFEAYGARRTGKYHAQTGAALAISRAALKAFVLPSDKLED